jgi:hypothetical protein
MDTLPVYVPGAKPAGFTTAVIAARDDAGTDPVGLAIEIQQLPDKSGHCGVAVKLAATDCTGVRISRETPPPEESRPPIAWQ